MKRSARPRVIANFARTADGKISTRNLTPSGFTSRRDLRRLLEIRASGDAVIVGRGTLEADQMSMGLRELDLVNARVRAGMQPEPARIVVTNSGRLDVSGPMFQSGSGQRIVFTTQTIQSSDQEQLEELADVHVFESSQVDLTEMLRVLRREYRFRSVVCEGGAALFRSLAAIGAVDVLHVTFGRVVFGGANAPTITGSAPDFFESPIPFSLDKIDVVDGECFATYRAPRSR